MDKYIGFAKCVYYRVEEALAQIEAGFWTPDQAEEFRREFWADIKLCADLYGVSL